ncbi:hypothetical protein F4810DRAFT_686710 [Camillea tinctor]|nr:hypothetical protein F4810DRAFT_686710 [Camillea tinctor]
MGWKMWHMRMATIHYSLATCSSCRGICAQSCLPPASDEEEEEGANTILTNLVSTRPAGNFHFHSSDTTNFIHNYSFGFPSPSTTRIRPTGQAIEK